MFDHAGVVIVSRSKLGSRSGLFAGLLLLFHRLFEAEAFTIHLEDVAMVSASIQQGCCLAFALEDLVPVTNGTAGEFAEISAAANLAGMAALVFVMRAGEKSNRGVAGLHGSLSFSLAGPFLGGCVR